MERRSWSSYFMKVAKLASTMSTCASGRKVGAVIVRDDRIISTGVNGVPRGYPHPEICERRANGIPSGDQLDLCVCVHAEANAIANAARYNGGVGGAVLYATCKPCSACMGLLANAGIVRVIFSDDYPDTKTERIAAYAEIQLVGVAP